VLVDAVTLFEQRDELLDEGHVVGSVGRDSRATDERLVGDIPIKSATGREVALRIHHDEAVLVPGGVHPGEGHLLCCR
jgi:hypothetical protein